MKKPTLLLLIYFGISFMFQTFGQLSITSYSIHAFGINTNTEKKISAELKTFTNRSFDDLIFELNGFYNFKAKEYHKASLGLGINIIPEGDGPNAITLPFQIEIFPLQNFKRLSIITELCPEYYFNDEDLRLRNLWGIRYLFKKE